ncbi:PKD domain-containing protein [Salinivibrio sp. ES.052]|uniref:PKD domain-containing protein n=1 Tax=Salinivibrio sp. ES.052 TaxID=1882823 RepID=UPI0009258674|nr:PKD domain-containing protein [Salinivibrio sp. ES.052]SIO37505.1 pre-peptidase C-terminal domain-containing protein [Salinivibrio sp. ES.052]
MKRPLLFCTTLAVMTLCSSSAVANIGDKALSPIQIASQYSLDANLTPPPNFQAFSLTTPYQKTIKVHQVNAAFIKVHFSQFSLPEGAYVTVSSEDGQEHYRYTMQVNGQRTFNAKNGEDGVNQFAAMSVHGDTAKVTLTLPAGTQWQSKHALLIDTYKAGDPSDEIIAEQDIGQLSTCGINERKDVACWQDSQPEEYERSRPVARLLMNGSGLCTGWRVGPDNHMFTNNHCVESQTELANTEVWFNYQRPTCGSGQITDVVKVTGAQLLNTDYTLDYTLFSVNNFAKVAQFGYMGLDVRQPQRGETIFIPQHGAGNPKELSIESDQNSGGICQIDVAITNGRGTGTDTGYFCDTTGGSSGSPVLAKDSHNVIALHHFGGCENQGVRIDKIWPQVAGEFDNVPPKGDHQSGGVPNAIFTGQCTALSCEFDANGANDSDGSIVSYQWDFGDGYQANGVTASHKYGTAGTYSVALTVTDDQGLTDSVRKAFTVDNVNDFPRTELSGQRSSWQYFAYTAPQAGSATVRMYGGTGDADLYVQKGTKPDQNQYQCRPYTSGNNERCQVDVNAGDEVFIGIRGYRTFTGVTLDVNP